MLSQAAAGATCSTRIMTPLETIFVMLLNWHNKDDSCVSPYSMHNDPLSLSHVAGRPVCPGSTHRGRRPP